MLILPSFYCTFGVSKHNIMKKILSIFAVVCFVAVNVSLAQTAPKADEKATKTEAVKSEAPAAKQHGCCRSSAGKSCSKEAMKSCGPNEKAEAGKGTDKAKAEASKKDTKSGTN